MPSIADADWDQRKIDLITKMTQHCTAPGTVLYLYSLPQQIDPSEDSNSNYYMTSDDDDEEVHRKKSRPLEISSYLRPGTMNEGKIITGSKRG